MLPETMRLPSGLNATLDTAAVWPLSGWPIGWPVSASHTFTVLSSLPETMRLPSGLNATLYTASVWPLSGLADRVGRVSASHTFTVSSPLPEAMRVPSGLNATLYPGVRRLDDLDVC